MGHSGALRHHLALLLRSLLSCSLIERGLEICFLLIRNGGGMECCENDPHPGIKFPIFFPALSQSRTLVNLRNPTGRALLKAGAA